MPSLVDLVREAGVVGAGGAGFPTHVKIDAKVDTVIANGSECEPLLHGDQHLMKAEPQRIIEGLQAVVRHTGAERGIVGIKAKYAEAKTALKEAMTGYEGLEIFELQDFYPAGDEFSLVYEITGRVIPEGGIPLQVGTLVNNVETLYNIANAIEGIPVTHKLVTVTGTVAKPLTMKLPVGISYAEAIELAGGATVENYILLDGGPMMGKVVEDPSSPITKTTNGVLLLPRDHRWVRKLIAEDRTALKFSMICCHCNMCTDICPRNLLGHEIYPSRTMRAMALSSMIDISSYTNAFLCSECGLCDFICPLDLLPREVNVMLKRRLSEAGVKNPHRRSELKPSPFRDYRKVPTGRLLLSLGLKEFDSPAPMADFQYEPEHVKIPLKQHIGAPAIPIVRVGQKVKFGQPIGEIPEGDLGARIHASISGTVVSVDERFISIKR
ncbi:4Fe-4S dicluster domain-containing protein [Candidatus Poribacteria bacterium]|nr:4Fe-4S dicluster domain-containing protein [Candidatus Poribacteria bacterium]